MTLSSLLQQKCKAALSQAFPAKIQALAAASISLEITPATQEKFGHYQLNSAMKLAKILGENPRQIAEKMVAALKSLPDASSLFAQIDIAGPGFINFTLHPAFISEVISKQLYDPKLGVSSLKPSLKTKAIIDFSSPNVAKEMHVGHLRSTIIGDCLANLLEYLGYDVLRLNHIGDWGTQFGMLIAYCSLYNKGPSSLEILPNIATDFAPIYQKAKKLFDENPTFKKAAQNEVIKLQSGDPDSINKWKQICKLSNELNQKIYDLLDVHLTTRGESFYNRFLKPMIAELEQQGLLVNSDNAKCMYLEGFTNRDGDPLALILQKKDGGFNYATTDMAALRYRVQEEHGQWLIYVTDAGQSLHFQMVFAAAQKAGFYDPNKVRIDHVPFGLVLKTDGKKFQTRSGETEKLIDLLEKAIATAKEKLLERNPDISQTELNISAKILGINAVKYADLACHRLSNYVFSYEKMLKFEGNTAAFVLYAYVRIRSIQRKTQVDIHQLMAQNIAILLEEPSEIALGLLACQFNEVLEDCARELLPNRLTDYLYRLAEKFHVFFHQCRVEGAPNQNSRLLLCQAVAQVLQQGIQLLGLKPLEKM